MKVQLAGSDVVYETDSQVVVDYITALGGRVLNETKKTDKVAKVEKPVTGE